jgi:cytochrome c
MRRSIGLVVGGLALATLVGAPAQAADAAKGKRVFNKCKACHFLDKPKSKLGPHLVGIIGRPSAAVEGFKYSKAMRSANIVWDEKNLDEFLAKPKKFMKGTKMAFRGLKKTKDRDNVIAYIKEMASK